MLYLSILIYMTNFPPDVLIPLSRQCNAERGIRHHMQRCGEHYIGETARALEKRPGKHQKQTTSAVLEHQAQAKHEIDWEGVKILDKESVDVKRKIKNAIHIRRQRPMLNRDGGYDLPAIFEHLLSRDYTICIHVTT